MNLLYYIIQIYLCKKRRTLISTTGKILQSPRLTPREISSSENSERLHSASRSNRGCGRLRELRWRTWPSSRLSTRTKTFSTQTVKLILPKRGNSGPTLRSRRTSSISLCTSIQRRISLASVAAVARHAAQESALATGHRAQFAPHQIQSWTSPPSASTADALAPSTRYRRRMLASQSRWHGT